MIDKRRVSLGISCRASYSVPSLNSFGMKTKWQRRTQGEYVAHAPALHPARKIGLHLQVRTTRLNNRLRTLGTGGLRLHAAIGWAADMICIADTSGSWSWDMESDNSPSPPPQGWAFGLGEAVPEAKLPVIDRPAEV